MRPSTIAALPTLKIKSKATYHGALQAFADLLMREEGYGNGYSIEKTVMYLSRQTLNSVECYKWLEDLYTKSYGKPPPEIQAPGEARYNKKPKRYKPDIMEVMYSPSQDYAFRKHYEDILSPAFYSSKAWRELRFDFLKENVDKGCALCGKTKQQHGSAIHVDHVIPRSRDPERALDKTNLQLLCEDCNVGKGNRDITDFRGNE